MPGTLLQMVSIVKSIFRMSYTFRLSFFEYASFFLLNINQLVIQPRNNPDSVLHSKLELLDIFQLVYANKRVTKVLRPQISLLLLMYCVQFWMKDKLRGDILVFFSSVMVNVSFTDILNLSRFKEGRRSLFLINMREPVVLYPFIV